MSHLHLAISPRATPRVSSPSARVTSRASFYSGPRWGQIKAFFFAPLLTTQGLFPQSIDSRGSDGGRPEMRCRFPHPGQISKGARGSTCNAAPGRFGSWEITVRDPYKIAACFPCRNPWQLSESQSRYEIAIPDDGTSRTKRRHPSAAPNMARRRAAHAVACVATDLPRSARGRGETVGGFFFLTRRRRRWWRTWTGGGGDRCNQTPLRPPPSPSPP